MRQKFFTPNPWLLPWVRRWLWRGRRLSYASLRYADNDPKRFGAVERESVVSLAVLLFGSVIVGGLPLLAIILAPVALVRVTNMLSFAVANIFFDTRDKPVSDPQRTILLLLLNIAQLAICFVIFDQAWANLSHGAFLDGTTPLKSYSQFAYMSWTTLLTMGSGYSPQNWFARFLLMSELGAGVIMLSVTIAGVLGAVTIRTAPDQEPRS